MSISAIGTGISAILTRPASAQPASSAGAAPSGVSAGLTSENVPAAFNDPAPPTYSDPNVQKFMTFMNESPAEQIEDVWLAQHGLTREELDKMSPDKRAAILKQMADDFKNDIEDKINKNEGGVLNITA